MVNLADIEQAIIQLKVKLDGARDVSPNHRPKDPKSIPNPISPAKQTKEYGATVVDEGWHTAEQSPEPETSYSSQGTSHPEPYASIRYAPMCVVTTTFVTYPKEPKEIRFFLGFAPFESSDTVAPQHYIVRDGFIVEDPKVFTKAMEPEVEEMGAKVFGKKSKGYDPKNTVRFTISGLPTRSRSETPSISVRCACSAHYASSNDDHSDRILCQTRAFGAFIADRLWNYQRIAGAAVPARFLD
ncbi:unnamed protein product [Caenorhabditis brenneri]